MKRSKLTTLALELQQGKHSGYVICNKCKGRGTISRRIRGPQRIIRSADILYTTCERCKGDGIEKAEDKVRQQVHVMKEGEVIARLLAARHDVGQEQVDTISKLLRRLKISGIGAKKTKKERAKEKRAKKKKGGSSDSSA